MRFAVVGLAFVLLFGTGDVDGLVRAQGSGAPISFALVRLLPSDAANGVARQILTDARGHYAFTLVPDGVYRVELMRIGYPPVFSAPFTVPSGERVEQDIAAPMRPIPLPAVVVHPPRCLQGSELADDARVAQLWEDAQRGVEIRRAFDLTYRYTATLVQKSDVSVPSRDIRHQERTDAAYNVPDSVVARETRRRALRKSEGYGQGNSFALPDEKELLEDDFLRTHCIDSPVSTDTAVMGLVFHPVDARGKGYAIAGTIWIDSSTHLMRRLELEYQTKGQRITTLVLHYEDVAVTPGTLLRLPASGTATGTLTNAPPGTTVAATLAYTYSRFELAPPR